MNRRCLPMRIVAFLVFAHPSLAFAQENGDTSDLEAMLGESVVTTAAQRSETSQNAPALSISITSEQLRRFGFTTVGSAIRFLALGMDSEEFEIDEYIGARGVALSGSGNSHVLVLLDGFALNEPIDGSADINHTMAVPMELVDHIEVTLGPGSVLYGTNAMLGVVNIVTKARAELPHVGVDLRTEFGRSARGAVFGGASFRLFGQKADVTYGFKGYAQFGPPVRVGPQFGGRDYFGGGNYRYSRYGEANGIWGGTVRNNVYHYVPSGFLQFRLGRLEGRLFGSLARWGILYISSELVRGNLDDPESYKQQRELGVDLRYSAPLSSIIELRSRAYARGFDYNYASVLSAREACLYPGVSEDGSCIYSETREGNWVGLENQVSFDWTTKGTAISLLGVDARLVRARVKQDVSDYSTKSPLAPSRGIPSAYRYTLGLYGQQTWDPSRSFGANLGARVDVTSVAKPAVSPRLALRWAPWDGGTIRGIYSEAFRLPTIRNTEVTSQTTVSNPNLASETVQSVEGILEQRFGCHKVTLGLFHSRWRSMIERRLVSPDELNVLAVERDLDIRIRDITQGRNVASIDNYGYNASLSGSIDSSRWEYALNATGSIARRDDGGGDHPLTLAPPLFGNASVSYTIGGPWPTVSLGLHYVSQRIMDRAFTGGFSRLQTVPPRLDVQTSVLGPFPFVPGLDYIASLFVASNNTSPWSIGPTINAAIGPTLEPAPIDPLRILLGLSYSLPSEK